MQNKIHTTIQITTLSPSFDYWNKNLLLAHYLESKKFEMKNEEVAKSSIRLGSYL
jgi:hypothetical protein